MRKRILLLAITAAFIVPASASADNRNVTIYGQARLSVDMVDSGGGDGTSTIQVSSNASYFGIKGSKELESDLSIIWQIEQVVHLDNSSSSSDGYGSTLATRNTFISLFDSTKGILALGRYNTPYKITTRYMDVFGDTIADNRSLMGGASLDLDNIPGSSAGASFDGNQGDVIAYVTPAFYGLTGAIAYVAGAEVADLDSQTKGDAWSGAVLYSNGPLNVNLGYEIHKFGTTGTGTLGPDLGGALPGELEGLKEEAWKVGVSYAHDPFILYAVYEQTKDNLGEVAGLSRHSDLFGHDAYYLAGKYQFGKNMVKAAFARSDDLEMDGNGRNTGASQWSVGYDRSLDSSTAVYVLYTKLNNDSAAGFNIHSPQASSSQATASDTGADPSAVSIGITHKF